MSNRLSDWDGSRVVPTGKFASKEGRSGTPWREVPREYVCWAAKMAARSPDLQREARLELHRRGHAFDPRIRCTTHAANMASVRVWPSWTSTRLDSEEGICDWLERIVAEVMPRKVEGTKLQLRWPPHQPHDPNRVTRPRRQLVQVEVGIEWGDSWNGDATGNADDFVIRIKTVRRIVDQLRDDVRPSAQVSQQGTVR